MIPSSINKLEIKICDYYVVVTCNIYILSTIRQNVIIPTCIFYFEHLQQSINHPDKMSIATRSNRNIFKTKIC